MTLMAHEAPSQDYLLESFLNLETPEGFRAELIEGEIELSPAPDGEHEDILSTLKRQVLRKSATDMDESATKGLKLPSSLAGLQDHVIPDATFAPRELRLFRSAASWMPAQGVAMVVEVTSTKPYRDRTTKRHSYADAGVPLYLLIDRERSTITLFSEPSGRDYTRSHSKAFGESLPLPAPFDFELDTADFL